MRKNKYRVWDPLNKKMHYMEFCLWTRLDSGKKGFVLPLGEQDTKDSYTIMNLDAVKVMRPVYLNDTNGKEIYEGDVVRYPPTAGDEDIDEHITVAIVEWDDTNAGFRIWFRDYPEHHLGPTGKAVWLHGYEIIGNIYEDPELVKLQ